MSQSRSKTCGFLDGLALRFAVPASNSALGLFKPQDFASPLLANPPDAVA